MSNKLKLILLGLFLVQIGILIWVRYDYEAQKSDFEIKLAAYLENPASVRILDLQGFELTDLPDDILQFQHVEVINLSYNNFEIIPPILYELSNLKRLNMSHNQLNHVILYTSATFTHLDLSHNQLKNIDGQAYVETLKNLNLSHNHLRAFPSLNVEIDTINMSFNGLANFRDIAAKFPKNVQHLDLSNNPFHDFRDVQLILNSCYSLDLSNNQAGYNSNISTFFNENYLIKKLFLNNCSFASIETLPASQLEILDIGNNKLMINDELVHQLKLKELNLEKQTLNNIFLVNLSLKELNLIDISIIGSFEMLLPNLEILHASESFENLNNFPDLPKLKTIYCYSESATNSTLLQSKYPNANIIYKLIND